MIGKQIGAQIKIYNPDNGKTLNFYTSNTSVQHKPGGNVSRNEPINPPPMLPPSGHHLLFKSQPPAIDFHDDYTTIMPSPPSAAPLPLTLPGASKALLSITPAVQASSSTHATNASSMPISATPLVSPLPRKKK